MMDNGLPNKLPNKSGLTLEQVERQRMERDRSGILFSNILRQVRGRIHQKEQLGSVENTMALAYTSQNGANGYRGSSNRPDTSFFKTSTD